MKTITTAGNPETISALMVPRTDDFYKEHDIVRLKSADTSESVEKSIFRVVDADNEGWELQFE